MTERTFPAGTSPRVELKDIDGDLMIHTWDGGTIKVDTDGRVSNLHQEEQTLVLMHCDSDVELWVPVGTTVTGKNVNGDVEIEGAQSVELENVAGDVELEDIRESIRLVDIGGDLKVTDAGRLLVQGSIGRDVSVTGVEVVEIESVGADLDLQQVGTVVVSSVGGDLQVNGVAAALRCGVIGGDCQVSGSGDAQITLGYIW